MPTELGPTNEVSYQKSDKWLSYSTGGGHLVYSQMPRQLLEKGHAIVILGLTASCCVANMDS